CKTGKISQRGKRWTAPFESSGKLPVMPSTFAAIDVGSNAMRLQVASVDQPGTYRILEQDRRPVRLGHGVFETGSLDPDSRAEALDALKRFKSSADKNG